jgi:hypothetical protein
MGYSRWEFNGITSFPCQVGRACGNLWFQYPEQSDYLSREELAIAIRNAEDTLSQFVGYNLMPDWDREVLPTPRHTTPEYTANINTRLRPKSIQVSKKYVRNVGVRNAVVLETVPVVREDRDGDGFDETVVIANAYSFDINEIRVFFPDDPDGEVRPVKVNASSIEFPIWLIVKEEYTHKNCVESLDAHDDTIFLEEVDIVRVYNDTSTQVTLIYEPTYCDDCNQTYTVGNCAYVEDEVLGYVVYNPRLYKEPKKVEINYYSGFLGKANRPLVELDPYWKAPIAYLAASFLDRNTRNCCDGNESLNVSQWQTNLIKRESGSANYAVTQFIIENPFGVVTSGAWFAYQRARLRKLA